MKIAVIGASGFVGLRLVERLHLGHKVEVVPIVHAYRSLAVLARFSLPWRVVDPSDPVALGEALRGCDVVVHAALGDANQIVTMAKALYPAAQNAGVKRIVALSSSAVHGLAPAPGTDESTPPLTNQKSEYNAAKTLAESILAEARKQGSVELVQLRPSIIYGPRSKLVAGIARELREGSAYLVNSGEGICNAVAVDNLIDAIWLAVTKPNADRQIFLINDRERITWRQFYTSIATAVGADMQGVHSIVPPLFADSASAKLARFAAKKSAMALMPYIPSRAKRIAKAAAAAWPMQTRPDGWRLQDQVSPNPTEELCLLQSAQWQYPTTKAQRLLEFNPSLSFEDGMARTNAWLDFVGISKRSLA